MAWSSENQPTKITATFTESLLQQSVVTLATDFESWKSEWNWKWSPERKEEVDCILAARFPLSICERVAQRITGSKTPMSPTSSTPSFSQMQQADNKILSRPARSPSPQTVSSFSPSSWSSSSFTMASTLLDTTSDDTFTTEFFRVKNTQTKGYAAFATKNIEEGTVIMSEAPLFRASTQGFFHELEKLSPQQRAEFRKLVPFRKLAASDRDLAIFWTNRFETYGKESGIFIKSSRFNHACHPFATCKYKYDGFRNLLIITACMDIQQGQEITISYTTCPSNLPGDYGFNCDCPGCPKPSK